MQGMIGHHAQALEMTALLRSRTARDDMKLLARRIDDSQTDAIKLMRRWLEVRGQPVPGEHAHHAPGVPAGGLMPGMLTAEEMARPDTTVFVARDDGTVVACGALRRHAHGVGEVKRMYTVPDRQGEGIGRRILDSIEGLARDEDLTRLVLETGHVHHAAWRVYEHGGFTRCGPVLDYPDTGWSVFYEKELTPSS